MQISFLWITLAIVAITYIYFLWIAGKSVREIESADDYFIAGRKLKIGSFIATLYAAEMSIATVFIAFFDLASILGLQLLIAVFTFTIGQFVLSRMAPKIKAINESRLTLPGVLEYRYNSNILRWVSLITITIGFGGLFATEILVGAQLVKPIFSGESYTAIIMFIATLVTFYTALGGFRNVIKTDRYQTAFVVIGVFTLVLAAYLLNKNPIETIKVSSQKGFMPSISLLINLLVINVAYPLVDLAAWQRIAAASDQTTAKKGGGYGAGAFFICWILILGAAIVLGAVTGKGGADGIFSAFSLLADISFGYGIIAGIGLGALLAALLSAGDIFLITATQSICMDATRRSYFSNSNTGAISHIQDAEVLIHARKITFIVAIISLIIVWFLMSVGARVSDLVFVIYGSTTALLPAVLMILLRPKDSLNKYAAAANISAIVGICMGWVYGILAIVGSSSIHKLLEFFDPVPGPVSTFNSASVALAWSIGIFTSMAFISNKKQ